MRLFIALVLFAALPAVASECSDRVTGLAAAAESAAAARDALTASRRQAQDFKNVLLRNGAEDHATFVKRLEGNMAAYAKSLEALGGEGASLRDEARKVEASYRAAVAMLDPRDPATVFKADAATKGVDVPTFRSLEQLVETRTRNYESAKAAATTACR